MTKPAKSPAMPFYGKDIYTDVPTLRLSFAAQGLYIRLLWWQWSEGSIPDDPHALGDVFGRDREVRKLWDELRPFFTPVADRPGYVANGKLEKIRAEMVTLREKRSGSGSKGGSKTAAKGVAKEQQTDKQQAPPAVASASAVASAMEETLFPSKSRSSRSNESSSDGIGNNGWTPPWTERQFQFKADKIAEWVNGKTADGVLPETDDFEVEFQSKWGMSYDRWQQLRPACESFFARRGAA